MSLPTVDELKENVGIEPNFVVMFMKKDKVMHMMVYENEPTDADINSAYNELDTDPEFGLVGKARKLDAYLFTKGEYQDILIENAGK